MFAKSRIDKLNTRAKYDTNSTTISKGLIKIGLLVGKNIFKNSIPLRRIPKILTPIKNDNARKNVTLKWLVNVKLYGIIPNKLLNKINKNTKNKNGTKIWTLIFKLFWQTFLTNKKIFFTITLIQWIAGVCCNIVK